MSVPVRRWLVLAVSVLLPVLMLAGPAGAQSLGSEPVSCDPADPAPGETTTCTAEGLEPSSAFTWEASFADGTTETGDGVADEDGTGQFEVNVPDSEEAEGDYTVTVTGRDAEGQPYEESHEGTVGGGGPLPFAIPPESEEDPEGEETPAPGEEPEDGGTEEPAPGGEDDGTFGAPDAGSDSQVAPVPDGAVAAGMGGTATDPGPLRALAVVLLVAAAVGHVVARRSAGAVTGQR